MTKLKYDVLLPKSKEQLESILLNLFKVNQKHLVLRIFQNYIDLNNLLIILEKYKNNIEKFRKNKSLIILSTDYDYHQIPEFISIVSTEEEANDIIDFEEIERQLFIDEI